jgi:hypothetical protein
MRDSTCVSESTPAKLAIAYSPFSKPAASFAVGSRIDSRRYASSTFTVTALPPT